jgi:hypothetical protein
MVLTPLQRRDFHMENGPEQEKRDEIFLSQLGKEIKGAFPSRWFVSFNPHSILYKLPE